MKASKILHAEQLTRVTSIESWLTSVALWEMPDPSLLSEQKSYSWLV